MPVDQELAGRRKSALLKKTGCSEKLFVKCLETIGDLKRKCENLGLVFVDYGEKDEIEVILDHKKCGLRSFYFVKWKNYSFKYCSWVQHRQLYDYRELVMFYKSLVDPPDTVNEELVLYFLSNLLFRKPRDSLVLKMLCSLVYGLSTDELDDLELTEDDLRCKVKNIIQLPIHKLHKIYNNLIILMQFSYERKIVLLRIQDWETEINKFTSPYVVVENQSDLELPPLHFKFIRENVSSIVDLKTQPIVFCSCENCDSSDSCCNKAFDAQFAYTKQGSIRLPPGHQIYECNDLCQCPEDCANRVVQHGQKVKVAIFRTFNGRGWGLRTLEVIQRGQFVMEYLGEVITSEEAEIRGEKYDYIGQTYLFDLDCDKDCPYTIDGCHVGNASHFINHSCDPNMQVYTVYINQQDPNLPRLAFFAKRKISVGEELTFDYKMQDTRLKQGKPIPQEERIPCKCNSKNCRQYLI